MNEFEFIKKSLQDMQKGLPQEVLSIGDDCSAVPLANNTYSLTTTDLLVENKHFDLSTTNFAQLGYKSLAASLSDVAAMGGVPRWAHLSIAVPEKIHKTHLEQFLSGFFELAKKYGVFLLGGDLSSSQQDFFINVVVTGEVAKENIKTRSRFSPGQELVAIGFLGHSRAGLKLLQGQKKRFSLADQELIQNHLKPDPLVTEGKWLGMQSRVQGMMDVSDGLLSSLTQLATVRGFRINCDNLYLSESLIEVCNENQWSPVEIAVAGGEDYGLLASIESGTFDLFKKEFSEEFSTPFYKIGEVVESGIRFELNGKPFACRHELPYEHFVN